MTDTLVHGARIAEELALRPAQVRAALELLTEGNTIPFVARYRKEATGELDEVQLRDIRDRYEYLVELEARRATILGSIEEQGKLDDALRARIEKADTKAELEDLYRPYKPKRRTRATIARERGLEPLAELIWEGAASDTQVRARSADFVNADQGVETADDALAGARDILAERIADDATTRAYVREQTREKGQLESRAARGKEGETSKFQDYYDFSEPLKRIPGHRVLAIRRGEAEDYLIARIVAPAEEIVAGLVRRFAEPRAAREEMTAVVADAYRRLIAPSVEVELRTEMKVAADEEAIHIFGQNLEGLLLAPPAGGRITLGIDPGYRTGCKLAVIGPTGALLDTGVLYLHQEERAKRQVVELVKKHGVELVGVGNGTASRETDRLVRDALKENDAAQRPAAVLVNEAGASVYSASELAREELPELDLTLRSAVSIGRRLQDPLAELVKIDPKSIGVGQYQHDVSQTKLKRRLDETVESCVNRVGVEVNTASPALLGYVAGLGPTIAQRIVEHRDRQGPFRSRRELRKVSGVGARTFEQSAGFLRIRNGVDALDSSAVHPERYPVVARMADELGVRTEELVGNEALVSRVQLQRYVDDEVGMPTLQDIVAELRKPGRDPREAFEAPTFRDDVETLEDLKEGMVLSGTVTNVVAFGAFVDIGVHQDGLVHVSQLSDRFVKDPNEVVRVGDRVSVRVMSVDVARGRIGLSMKSEGARGEAPAAQPRRKQPKSSPPPLRDGVAPNGMRIRRRN